MVVMMMVAGCVGEYLVTVRVVPAMVADPVGGAFAAIATLLRIRRVGCARVSVSATTRRIAAPATACATETPR